MSRRTKTPRKKAEDRLDKLVSQVVRNKFKWICQRCHRDFSDNPGQLHHAHIISRNKRSVRWESNNGLALCVGCHLMWQHAAGNSIEFVRLAEYILGRNVVDALLYKSEKPAKFSLADLELLRKDLERELATLL